MTVYTPQQIYQFALRAGFTSAQAVKWTAIALAESGGEHRAHATAGEDSVGLWQINLRAHRGKLRGRDPYDPLVNAQLAYEISGGGVNARPWTVTWPVRNGKPNPNFYAKYINIAQQAANAGGSVANFEMGNPNAYNSPGSANFRAAVNNVIPGVGPIVFPLQGFGPNMLTRSGIGDPRPGGTSHKGLDLMAPFNTPIVSATNGTVRAVGIGGGRFGWRVNIQDAQGNIHSYAHMHRNPAEVGIREGMPISAGQLIGYVGNSGTGGTDPHLHYSINEAQYDVNRGRAIIDPYQVLTSGNIGNAGMTDYNVDSTMTGAEANQTAADLFPQFMGFMSIPGVADIIAEAVRDFHTPGWVTNRLQQLPWWKETNEHRRLAQALKDTDPATYDQRVREKAEQLIDVYSRLGIKPPFESFADVFTPDSTNRESKLYQTAELYYLGNFSADAIGQMLLKQSTPKDIGQVASVMEDLSAIAAQYFVRVPVGELQDIAMRVLRGEYNGDQFTQLMKQQAKGLFAFDKNLMQQIDNGVTPEALFSNHKNALATQLEIDPDSIDFLNDKYLPVINFVDKDTGNNRVMNINEVQQYARSLPEFEKTSMATQEVSNFVNAFQGIFGRA